MTSGPPHERRVKIHKVSRFVFDIAAEYFQVIGGIQNRFDSFDKLPSAALRAGRAGRLTINVVCHC
jgi:hypothetical protein